MVEEQHRFSCIFGIFADFPDHLFGAGVVDKLRKHEKRKPLHVYEIIEIMRAAEKPLHVGEHLFPWFVLASEPVVVRVHPYLARRLFRERGIRQLLQHRIRLGIVQVGDVAAVHDKVHAFLREEVARHLHAPAAFARAPHVRIRHYAGRPQRLLRSPRPQRHECARRRNERPSANIHLETSRVFPTGPVCALTPGITSANRQATERRTSPLRRRNRNSAPRRPASYGCCPCR